MLRFVWTMVGAAILGVVPSASVVGAEGSNRAGAAPQRGAVLTIPAYAFDRGNVQTFTSDWADGEPMVAYGGQSPVFVEYDLDLPVTGEYALSISFAAAASRPIELLLDGKPVGTACHATTGSWYTRGAKWEAAGKLNISAGKHTLRFQRDGDFPHVVRLRLESSQSFPPDWKLKRPQARALPVAPGQVDVAALRRAMADLTETFGAEYVNGPAYLARLDALEAELDQQQPAAAQKETRQALAALQRQALLANPLLDFERLLLIKRGANSPHLGLPLNWQSNSSLPKRGYDDTIVTLSLADAERKLSTVFRPKEGRFVGDVDLNFEAEKFLFSMPGDNGRWQVFEARIDGSGLRQLTGQQPDVDCYDACYLPSEKILFTSTACFTGVPCVYGDSHVATLYVMDREGKNIRQLCFDQEHNWCPTVLPGGKVMYQRWEYADTPHSNTRLLFQMNPDGTEQGELYGSNSYWPNSIFYARPVPNHPTKLVAVVGGHHDHPRMGELVVFDPARGAREADGAVQRIPGYGKKVEPLIRDGLTLGSWPKYLHPYPLSDKYFLAACKPTPQSLWGIYLVDVFDNLTLIAELPGYALFEPIPLRKTPRPPVIADKVNLASKTGTVYISDIYAGGGLRDVPRGTVKSLRVFTYHFAYQNMGGLIGVIGMDGPWDIKRVIGTVPVYDDGSAKFHVPANTPISVQPLDDRGQALQLMRSWMTAMPGEKVSCTGCHDSPRAAPRPKLDLAQARPIAEIEPWHGPTRGFSYPREVQPVIDRHCIGCHNGKPSSDGAIIPDLRGDVKITDWRSVMPGNGGRHAGKFSVGYAELHRFVRRPGIESDYHLLEPMEFHAGTTELVQMLEKGHHNVKLDKDDWDRLITWIDMNCPYHGTWGEELDRPGRQRDRRRELLKLYANVEDDPEAVPEGIARQAKPTTDARPADAAYQGKPVDCPNWPFDAAEARRRQASAGGATRQTVDLGEGLTLELAYIPAGEFVMGSTDGAADEHPATRVAVKRPFWIATREVTNEQFRRFAPEHDSRVESKDAYQFGIHGYPGNQPAQPVVRVTWKDAMAFCQWLSARTGRKVSLPTEAQWEYACRAGASTPFSFGDIKSDFSQDANLADAKLTEFTSNPYTVDQPLSKPSKYDDWIPKDSRFNDGAVLAIAPGRYRPNGWSLLDMHGNVAEWTRSAYRPYPYDPRDGRDDPAAVGRKVVRGGSWRDRPYRATSSYRLGYQPYQRVYNVGFRVVCEIDR